MINKILNNKPIRSCANSFMARYSGYLLKKLETTDIRTEQTKTFINLIARAKNTKFGKDHGFSSILSVEDYQKAVPLRTYEDFMVDYWKESFPVIDNITCPGRIPYFALTSGTATGKTKYIPLTTDMLRSNRLAALTMLGPYYQKSSIRNILNGHFLFLGGSTDLKYHAKGICSGDLSGITLASSPSWLKAFSFPHEDIALTDDWDKKLKQIVSVAKDLNITAISGVPSWLLILFSELKKATGKDRITDIWQGLSLIVHGGVNFAPYHDTFRKEISDSDVLFMETYPCSEGFIAFEDLRYNKLRLMTGHDIFYEFIPVDELKKDNPVRHTMLNFETGINYAIVITTPAGLWSYIIGDTICFENYDPPLLRFTGRTEQYLSAFGEHLICEEVEKAVNHASASINAIINDFHAGPVFPDHNTTAGSHLFIIEFEDYRNNPDEISMLIDNKLKELNEDYRAHRTGDISIGEPKIIALKPGSFTEWMRSKGKLGGQNKVPRLDNTGKLTMEIKKWMTDNNKIQVPNPKPKNPE